ncbi:hypothetical protein CYQ73_12350, partial [Enterococcus faecium]
LEAMDMDTLTKGRYVQLLARGYSPKEVFKALKKHNLTYYGEKTNCHFSRKTVTSEGLCR